MDFYKAYKEKIVNIANNNNLKFVILYGSLAKNVRNINSDIDIAVLGNGNITFENIIDMNNEFSEIFCVKETDVKSLHNVDPLFRYQVTSNGILLFGNQHEYSFYKAYAFRDYCDSGSLLALRLKFIKKRLENLKKIK